MFKEKTLAILGSACIADPRAIQWKRGRGKVQSEMVLSCLLLDKEGEEKMDPFLL